ncbi:MAG: HAD-IA family hydrolase [Planctomycetaceae bacterium]|jgi:phosphoglycolate phosphatase|nr:HAD-IA family hydrolase [Planctomycetaceae bacterium]
MGYINILFDLDGTLTNPCEGITNSVKYSLGKFNVIENNNEKLKMFIGPPLEKSFMEYYDFDKNTAQKAIKYYREYFSEKGIYENRLYEGIENVLKELNIQNKNCIIATSKPETFAIKIVQYFQIEHYFKHITGSNMEGTFVEKEDIIKYILEKYNLEKEVTIMVGDRKYDIIGANKNRIDSVGVLYGYGTKEELQQEKPTYLCNSVNELLQYF